MEQGPGYRQVRAAWYHSRMTRGLLNDDPAVAVGRAVLELRLLLGWTQAELARRAGVTQSSVSKVERARFGDVTLASATNLLAAMGARLTVGVDRPYVGDRLQIDAAHVQCVGHVGRRLETAGWLVAREVEVGGGRSRGWIDILAFHAASGLLLVIEIKTELRDVGQLERTLGWYEREAWAAARRLSWRPRRVVGAVLLLATEVNEERIRANREGLATTFPVRASALAGLIQSGVAADLRRGLALIDPRSKRRQWLRPSRADGRRSAAPYADYIDFMRHIR
jgi:transcriptional regulator with XRE-family HTH domain